jgi:hypothetical protein
VADHAEKLWDVSLSDRAAAKMLGIEYREGRTALPRILDPRQQKAGVFSRTLRVGHECRG